MAHKKSNNNAFEKIATFIVDKRTLFFLLYSFAFIFCLFSMGWVTVENDVTTYLPETTETRQGLVAMNENFAVFGTAQIMVSNVTYDEAVELYEQITQVEGVTMVDFSNTPECYKDANALLSITFDGTDLQERNQRLSLKTSTK